MKLRLRSNSLRLRLTKSEVARFAETGRVEEVIEFGLEPSQRLAYSLERDAENEEMRADFGHSHITVFVSRTAANEWTSTEQIAMETDQNIGAGKILHLLVEKDFACLEARPGEDDDAFPHPLEEKNTQEGDGGE